MRTLNSVDIPDDVAVFSRNHRNYLDAAVTIGTKDSSARTVFRSRTRWVTAERAIGRLGGLPIYLAAVGGPGKVEYRAELCGVLLDPAKGSRKAAEWLARVLESTADEGFWDPPLRTLYEIRACQKLEQSFPITRLVKVSNGKPISADFAYSYSIVRAIDHLK